MFPDDDFEEKEQLPSLVKFPEPTESIKEPSMEDKIVGKEEVSSVSESLVKEEDKVTNRQVKFTLSDSKVLGEDTIEEERRIQQESPMKDISSTSEDYISTEDRFFDSMTDEAITLGDELEVLGIFE